MSVKSLCTVDKVRFPGFYRHKNGNYYVRIYQRGYDMPRSLGVKNFELALQMYYEFQHTVFGWKSNNIFPMLEARKEKDKRVKLITALDEWVTDSRLSGNSESITKLKREIKKFLLRLKDVKYVDMINQDIIKKFYAGLGGYANNTLRTYNSQLKSFLSYCIEKSYLKKSVIDDIKFMATKRETRSKKILIADKQYQKILDYYAYDQRRQMYVRMLYEAGLRPEEGLSVKYSDINFEKMTIFCRQSKIARKVRSDDLAEKTINITREFADDLNAYCIKYGITNDAYLFRGHTWPGRQNDKYVQNNWDTLRERLGLPADIVLYSFRHTFATRLYFATNGNIEYVRSQMGHTSAKTTLDYLHDLERDNRSVFDAAKDVRL